MGTNDPSDDIDRHRVKSRIGTAAAALGACVAIYLVVVGVAYALVTPDATAAIVQNFAAAQRWL